MTDGCGRKTPNMAAPFYNSLCERNH